MGMKRRNSREDIDDLVRMINGYVNNQVEVDKSIGGYRLTCNKGGRDLSPRLPGRDMILWLEGYTTGMLTT